MVSKALTVFDYKSIEKETAGKLRCLAGQVKRSKGGQIKSIIEIGSAIHEAHELLAGNGRDGKFREWVEMECGFEKSTAYHYLHSFEAFSKCDVIEQFSPTAMYALASPNTPAKARTEAIKRAANGHKIVKAVADEIIDSFTVEPETSVQPLDTSAQPASVTGTGNNPPSASPPSLPSVGTVNQTETGSQGDGDAGECIKGGGHTFEDGACSKCLEPDDSAKMGPLDFKPATLNRQLEAERDGKPDLAKLQAPYDTMLNAITQIKKAWNDVTSDERDGVYCVTKRQRVLTLLDELRPPIAQARPMKVCTFCKGKGCEKCSGCGWWPRSVVEGLSR